MIWDRSLGSDGADLERLEPTLRHRPLQLRRPRHRIIASPGPIAAGMQGQGTEAAYDDDARSRAPQPAYQKSEDACRGLIEPLGVIDRDHERPIARLGAHRCHGRKAERQAIDRLCAVVQPQDGAQHLGLRCGERVHGGEAQVVEHAHESRVGEVHLRPGGLAHRDGVLPARRSSRAERAAGSSCRSRGRLE